MSYTDKEYVQIAQQEYEQFDVGNSVTIGEGVNKKTIGYVSEVINNPKTGEQTYIVTDGNPKTQKPEDVKKVTFLNQGREDRKLLRYHLNVRTPASLWNRR